MATPHEVIIAFAVSLRMAREQGHRLADAVRHLATIVVFVAANGYLSVCAAAIAVDCSVRLHSADPEESRGRTCLYFGLFL